MLYISKDCISWKNVCMSPTECPWCELKYMFSAANSSFLFDAAKKGGWGLWILLKILGCSTTTVGEADGRALSGIFGLVWAVFDYFVTFCRLIIILPPCFVCCNSEKVWSLGLGLSWPIPHFIPHICHRHHGENFSRLSAKNCIFYTFRGIFLVFCIVFGCKNLGFKNPTCVKEMTNMRYASYLGTESQTKVF